jgi:hypothetical protein
MLNDCTLLICNYNTPDCIKTVLKSFVCYHDFKQKILIIENSTNNQSKIFLDEFKVPYLTNEGGKHSPSIDIGFQNIDTKYALIVDSDVVFMNNIEPVFNAFKNYRSTIAGELQGDRGGFSLYPRISPVFCFVDLEKIKKFNIKFHDQKRIDDTKSNGFFGNIPINYEDKSTKFYDVGSTFLEDIKKEKLIVSHFNGLSKYIKHLEGGSWYLDSNNEGFIEYGKKIKAIYNQYVDAYKDVSINGKFY